MKVLAAGFLINYPVSALAAESCIGEVFVSCNVAKNEHLQVCIEPATDNAEPKFTYKFSEKENRDFR